VTLDVNMIATDADLANEVGDLARLTRAMPRPDKRDSARAAALSDVLAALRTRTPSIFAESLIDPNELKKAVVYRALSKIFLAGVAIDGDTHAYLSARYEREYQGAIRGSFTVAPGVAGPSGWSFSWERR
jgi:hypothetical protein